MVLIIDVIEPHLIVEDVDEGDLHPWKIIDLRHKKSKSKYWSTCQVFLIVQCLFFIANTKFVYAFLLETK